MKIERDELLKHTKKIVKHLRSSGGIFGDSSIPNEENIHLAMADALIDIGEYCEKYEINVSTFDSIKLLAFSLPHIIRRDPSINSERYIFSIFQMLEESYKKKINFDKKINDSIKVSDKLFRDNNCLVMYGYIKGFQEALEYTKDK